METLKWKHIKKLVFIAKENIGFFIDELLSMISLYTKHANILPMGLLYTSPSYLTQLPLSFHGIQQYISNWLPCFITENSKHLSDHF